MATLLATERLILRDWEDRDRIPFIAMNQDAEVMRYFPSTLTADQTEALLQRIQDQHAKHGYGLWVVERKEDGAFLGFTGLSNPGFETDFTPCTEVGWRFRKEYWGNGYATEAAKACLEYGFQNLALEKIYSFTAVHNLLWVSLTTPNSILADTSPAMCCTGPIIASPLVTWQARASSV
jgi:[ribosomal protein S5]-alanine N-acetyltransferase